MTKVFGLRDWLVEQCADSTFNVSGVFQRESDLSSWPLKAQGPDELEARLSQGGHLLPLPKEPAALANVLETSIVSFLMRRAQLADGAGVRKGNERGYPDLEISGPAFTPKTGRSRLSADGSHCLSRGICESVSDAAEMIGA